MSETRFVRKFLDLSTGHLPPAVMLGLNSYEGVIAYEDKHGAWLWVPDDVDEYLADYPDVPAPVESLWRAARHVGCDYIRLDQDGPVHPQLNTWEW